MRAWRKSEVMHSCRRRPAFKACVARIPCRTRCCSGWDYICWIRFATIERLLGDGRAVMVEATDFALKVRAVPLTALGPPSTRFRRQRHPFTLGRLQACNKCPKRQEKVLHEEGTPRARVCAELRSLGRKLCCRYLISFSLTCPHLLVDATATKCPETPWEKSSTAVEQCFQVYKTGLLVYPSLIDYYYMKWIMHQRSSQKRERLLFFSLFVLRMRRRGRRRYRVRIGHPCSPTHETGMCSIATSRACHTCFRYDF